jgi:hypothetical protein
MPSSPRYVHISPASAGAASPRRSGARLRDAGRPRRGVGAPRRAAKAAMEGARTMSMCACTGRPGPGAGGFGALFMITKDLGVYVTRILRDHGRGARRRARARTRCGHRPGAEVRIDPRVRTEIAGYVYRRMARPPRSWIPVRAAALSSTPSPPPSGERWKCPAARILQGTVTYAACASPGARGAGRG